MYIESAFVCFLLLVLPSAGIKLAMRKTMTVVAHHSCIFSASDRISYYTSLSRYTRS